jgi:hypothetical protein
VRDAEGGGPGWGDRWVVVVGGGGAVRRPGPWKAVAGGGAMGWGVVQEGERGVVYAAHEPEPHSSAVQAVQARSAGMERWIPGRCVDRQQCMLGTRAGSTESHHGPARSLYLSRWWHCALRLWCCTSAGSFLLTDMRMLCLLPVVDACL